ncbi:DNA gyrase inhibitor YacG [Psychrobacter sp. UBA3962]|uniref:DNA gyrase inhibitor YacG n=1 Tax=Psychrobacter sp. UBA3962 TaxID=1947352 RepID=UPI0025D3AFFD|nr:DNA gyrase inhibitor YacG [Psychrobacter sp. UBA3962]
MTDSTDHSSSPSSPKTYPCPRCKKLTAWQDNPYKPFCSDRCKLIDLGAWANEEYRVAAEESPFSDDLNY